MLILGITGGVATGKSTVTQMLGDLGAAVVSADQIGRDLLAPGSNLTHVVARAFADCVMPDAAKVTIDRRALGKLVFSDSQARERLEGILHPPIVAELTRQVAALRRQSVPPAAAVEIPLLFEAGLQELVDSILVVTCDEKLQLERLQKRSIGHAEALQHIAAQMTLAAKEALADHVITTNSTLDDTRAQVYKTWKAVANPRSR